MAVVSLRDTTEGSGELDLETWLKDNRLSSLLKNTRFMEQELMVKDFLELDENDLNNFVEDKELKMTFMEKKKFKTAIRELQCKTQPHKNQETQKKSVIYRVTYSEAEENAIENAKKRQNKLEIEIKKINECLQNTENNAKNCENIINQQFNKIIQNINQRKTDLQKKLQAVKDRKLKIYKDNLAKITDINEELLNLQIEWNDILLDPNMKKSERKTKITTQSQNILAKSMNLLKNEIIHSVNDTFNVKFNSNEIYEQIGNIGRVDGNEIIPELSVVNVKGNEAEINIEFKCEDNILLFGLQCKEINNEDIFMDDEDDEKKENISEYFEFVDSKYLIKNLKYSSKYCIKSKAKISNNIWTNYSNYKIFDTKQKGPTWISDSKILTNPNEILIFENLLKPKLKTILKKEKLSLKLIYRNSIDGNSSTAFHNKCNGYCNTLIVIHSNYNNIFGAFTTHKWKGQGGYQRDDNTFLFLIRSVFNHKARIYKLLKKDNQAVFDSSSYGPTFGNGHDLVLQENGNNSTHYSYLGYDSRYEGQGNVLCGGDTDKTNVAQHKFKLKEYEVFVVS